MSETVAIRLIVPPIKVGTDKLKIANLHMIQIRSFVSASTGQQVETTQEPPLNIRRNCAIVRILRITFCFLKNEITSSKAAGMENLLFPHYFSHCFFFKLNLAKSQMSQNHFSTDRKIQFKLSFHFL